MNRARQPGTLSAYVRWIRYAYQQEPPVRIHSRETGVDGNPAYTGEFIAWLRGSEEQDVACATDEEGYFRTPLRCCLYLMHGRDEGSSGAAMAHLALAIAITDWAADDVGRRHGIEPTWARPIVIEEVLRRVWSAYSPLPRGPQEVRKK